MHECYVLWSDEAGKTWPLAHTCQPSPFFLPNSPQWKKFRQGLHWKAPKVFWENIANFLGINSSETSMKQKTLHASM